MGPIVLVQVGTYGRPNCPVMVNSGKHIDWSKAQIVNISSLRSKIKIIKFEKIKWFNFSHLVLSSKRIKIPYYVKNNVQNKEDTRNLPL